MDEKELSKKHDEALRFIHTKYHFGGFYPKRVWNIAKIAELMEEYAKQKCIEQKEIDVSPFDDEHPNSKRIQEAIKKLPLATDK